MFSFQSSQDVQERLLTAVEKLEKKVAILEKERENQQLKIAELETSSILQATLNKSSSLG